jgi:hypothetical protein
MSEKKDTGSAPSGGALPVTVQEDEAYLAASPGQRADMAAHAEERAGLDRAGEEVGLPPPPPVDEAAEQDSRAQRKADRKAKRAAKHAKE